MNKTILVCAVSSCLMAFANAAEYKLSTDVLVIGAGSAGLTAAVQRAEKGKKVILLEKNPMVGGSSQFAEGLFAVESEQDPIVDGPAALRWMDACTGPKEIIKLTNAGHLIPLEKGWQEGTDTFAAFVLSHTPDVSASAINAAGQPHPRRS